MTDTPTALPPPPDLTQLPSPPSATQAPPSPDLTQQEPLASLVLYLNAARFVEHQKEGKTGQRSFNGGAVVKPDELAQMVVCIALWELQRLGAIQLTEYHEKKLGFLPLSGVRATPGAGTQRELTGYEASLLRALGAEKHFHDRGSRVETAVKAALPKVEDSVGSIIATMQDQAVKLGYLVSGTAEVTGIKAVLGGHTSRTLEPVPERIAELTGAADRLVADLNAFIADADGLWQRLRREVRFGIQLSEANDDTD